MLLRLWWAGGDRGASTLCDSGRGVPALFVMVEEMTVVTALVVEEVVATEMT